MKVFDLNKVEANSVSVETLLELIPVDSGNVSFGVATFSAGIRHPEQGMGCHEQHEVSYIVEGRMNIHRQQGTTAIEPGQVVWLDANEPHAATAIEDGKVFWVLYG